MKYETWKRINDQGIDLTKREGCYKYKCIHCSHELEDWKEICEHLKSNHHKAVMEVVEKGDLYDEWDRDAEEYYMMAIKCMEEKGHKFACYDYDEMNK